MQSGNDQLNLMKVREAAQMTQREWAQLLGVTISTVSNWETGRQTPRLTFTQTKLMLQASGLTINDLEKAFKQTQSEKAETDQIGQFDRRKTPRRVRKTP